MTTAAFTASRYEMSLILEIARRAADAFSAMDRPVGYWAMDIENCHMDAPLRLHELLAADQYEFAHDVLGIYDHLNRKTGKLEGCFVPRYAINQEIAA